MRGRLLAGGLVVAAIAAGYWFLIRDTSVEPRLHLPPATATIGTGSEAVAVGPDGQILAWLPLSEDLQLPSLPLSAPPKDGRLSGPVLQQARVLGAAPATLRPYLESSYYGESGIDVRLRSGIELRFGDASQATTKWKAAAAVLADPSVTALDYVDLHAPGRPAVGGSGHTLPPAE
ncbi:MAG TPA: cell division protein FtsQ/DivIB [Solirubrobacterales bacterium]|nr:cell division protein FtsQ/DivIB [Solirubrobacterales bacterium]